MNFKIIAAIGLVSTIIVGSAFAQNGESTAVDPAVKKTLGGLAAPQSRADAEAKVKALFDRMDADRDGIVTSAETAANRAVQRSEARSRLFDKMDANNDGALSKDEFDQASGARSGTRRANRAASGAANGGRNNQIGNRQSSNTSSGRYFDTNGDGQVNKAEMTAATLARFDLIDANKDGIATPDERRAYRAARYAKRAN